eukprot:2238766-Amphidinium_carterae.1
MESFYASTSAPDNKAVAGILLCAWTAGRAVDRSDARSAESRRWCTSFAALDPQKSASARVTWRVLAGDR